MNQRKPAVVIGAGRISWQLEEDKLRYKPCTHLGAIGTLYQKGKKKDYELIAIQDKNKKKVAGAINFVKKLTGSKPEPVVGAGLELLDQRPDLLILSQSTQSHAEFLLKAIEYSIPKIVVEKPICITKDEAEEIRAAYTRSTSKIWINYERRYLDRYLELKKVINSKELGSSLFYRAFFSAPGEKLFPNKTSEGVLLHDTTHLVDLAQFLFGKVLSSKAEISPTMHALRIKHQSTEGEVLTNCRADYFHFEIQVFFEKGRVRAVNGAMYFEKTEPSKAYSGFTSLSKVNRYKESKITMNRNPMIRLYQDVYDGKEPNMIEDACDNVLLLSQDD